MGNARAWIGAAVLAATCATQSPAQQSKLTDRDLSCYSNETCQSLVGRKVWGAHNVSEICTEINPTKGCSKLPIGTAMTIDGLTGQGQIDTFFLMRLADGRTGFVRTANSHLLTLTDPRPAQEAAKKRQGEVAEKAKQRDAEDVAALAAIPRSDLEKGCILAAAEHLPRIPGIQIVSSKTISLPPEHKPPAGTYMTIVEIAAKAAGQDVTYSFICAKGMRTPSLITPFAQR